MVSTCTTYAFYQHTITATSIHATDAIYIFNWTLSIQHPNIPLALHSQKLSSSPFPIESQFHKSTVLNPTTISETKIKTNSHWYGCLWRSCGKNMVLDVSVGND